ncbi:hypothetical protein OSB04_010560 [Centaurea solstitialis]|uniref:Uncharacterized protein n=1 Tax=Centaurea solstitialis TaxID=347529 RepID=A0AA38TL21_9ASTR|nr:hypothetical protein OSB04_010560 [Centaurea solstitialis]
MTATRDAKAHDSGQGDSNFNRKEWSMRYFLVVEDEYCQNHVDHFGCREFAFLTMMTTTDTKHEILVKRIQQIRGVDYDEVFSPLRRQLLSGLCWV